MIYIVPMSGENRGTSVAESLRGGMENWPNRFSGDVFGTSCRTTKACMLALHPFDLVVT